MLFFFKLKTLVLFDLFLRKRFCMPICSRLVALNLTCHGFNCSSHFSFTDVACFFIIYKLTAYHSSCSLPRIVFRLLTCPTLLYRWTYFRQKQHQLPKRRNYLNLCNRIRLEQLVLAQLVKKLFQLLWNQSVHSVFIRWSH